MTTTQFLLTGWTFDSLALAVGAAVVVGFALAWRAVRHQGTGQARYKSRFFFLTLALMVIALALVSPIAVLTDGYLFSAHMVQHLLLLLIAPPLLLLSLPLVKTAVQGPADKNVGETAGKNACATRAGLAVLSWLAGVGAMWVWHAPALCNAATSSLGVHRLQVISLLFLGLLFWWPILGSRSAQGLAPFAGIAYLVSACMACTLLGIIVTFAPVSVCSVYMHPVDRLGILPLIRDHWGLTPAVDQQIGGLMMWVPSCLVYLSAVLGLLARYYANDRVEAPVANHVPEPNPGGTSLPRPIKETC